MMSNLTLVSGFQIENFFVIECDLKRISQNEQKFGFLKEDVFFLKGCMIAVNVKAFVI